MVRHDRLEETLHAYHKLRSVVDVENSDVFYARSQQLFHMLQHTLLGISFKEKRPLGMIFVDLILSCISIITILKFVFKKESVAHYMIDRNNSKEDYDSRSTHVLSVLKPEATLNFFHVNDPRYSLKTLFKKKNAIYFESLFSVFSFLIPSKDYHFILHTKTLSSQEREQFSTVAKEYQNTVKRSSKLIRFMNVLISLSHIQKFVLLDDSRHTGEIRVACKQSSVPTIGYMHGRFNEIHVGLFDTPFDMFLVWSNYFKKSYRQFIPRDQKSIVNVVGYPLVTRLSRLTSFTHSKTINVLLIGEANVDYQSLISYFKYLHKQHDIQLFFRGKPGNSSDTKPLDDFVSKNKILLANTGSFLEALENNNIQVVIGTHSTALMECLLGGVPSIIFKSTCEYGMHLVRDKISGYATSQEDLYKQVKKFAKLSSKEREKIRERAWKGSVFKKKEFQKLLLS